MFRKDKHSSLFPGTEATKRKKRVYDVDLPVSTTEGEKRIPIFDERKRCLCWLADWDQLNLNFFLFDDFWKDERTKLSFLKKRNFSDKIFLSGCHSEKSFLRTDRRNGDRIDFCARRLFHVFERQLSLSLSLLSLSLSHNRSPLSLSLICLRTNAWEHKRDKRD